MEPREIPSYMRISQITNFSGKEKIKNFTFLLYGRRALLKVKYSPKTKTFKATLGKEVEILRNVKLGNDCKIVLASTNYGIKLDVWVHKDKNDFCCKVEAKDFEKIAYFSIGRGKFW